MSHSVKPIPKSVLIFGATSRTGKPAADFLSRERPDIKLRLATSSYHKKSSLAQSFPAAEVVVANYNDLTSLKEAVDGIEGIFVVTPSGTEERPAMENLVIALQDSNVVHIVRLLGVFPEFNLLRVPEELKIIRTALPIQHPIAKSILDKSELPVTYINSGATFMDNLFLQIRSVAARKQFIWPEHCVPFIDPREVGEVAARLLLSENAKHIGLFHTMNNGNDYLRYEDVSAMLSEVLGLEIPFNGKQEDFFDVYTPIVGERNVKRLWTFLKFEEANEVGWALNDFVQRILCRKPKTLRDWLLEHKDLLLAQLSRDSSL